MNAQPVLDPASGPRMFYFDSEDDRVLFGDIRSEQHVLCDGRALEINPNKLMDFRDLPFRDNTFAVVIFDPPHLVKAGPKHGRGDGRNGRCGVSDRRNRYRCGHRVARPKGRLTHYVHPVAREPAPSGVQAEGASRPRPHGEGN